MHMKFFKLQQTVVLSYEINNRDQPSDNLSCRGCNGSTGQSPVKNHDQHIVQNTVYNSGCHICLKT